MRALVLERPKQLSLREIDIPQTLGANDVRIAMRTVGICGSDLHYYLHGKIGPFVVREPMVLGHEGSGEVVEIGANVRNLALGDRVCIEPGVPDWSSKASRLGLYNLDPSLTFWATPPDHGCLTPEVVHPASLTFKLPDNVSFAEGAFVEPLAVGMQAATKARIQPGSVGVVLGAGTIGVMTALAALAAGCSRILITDVQDEKLATARRYDGIETVNVAKEKPLDRIMAMTAGWGADVVFEASGNPRAYDGIYELACPGGCVVLIGNVPGPITVDIMAALVKELRVEHVFRYANVFPRTVALLASGKIDLKPLISRTYAFDESIEAFEFAAEARPDVVKVQIEM